MKNTVLSLIASATTFYGTAAFACMPPPNLFYIQGGQLNTILSAPTVREQILTLGASQPSARGIRNIAYAQGGYTIETQNGCHFLARVEYDQPATPGMCPRVKGVTVSDAVCP